MAFFNPSPARTPVVRRLRTAYALLAMPLAIFSAIALVICFGIWKRGHDGTGEGLEFDNAADPYFLAALAVFLISYLLTLFFPDRVASARHAWLPFALQIPALPWLLIAFFTSAAEPLPTVFDKAMDIAWPLYLAVLLTLLGATTLISLRTPKSQSSTSPEVTPLA